MPDAPAATPTTPHTVFVSHAHADNALCDHYVDALRQRGLDVWYDRSNLRGGQRLDQEIERELQRRSALVVLLTPASVASYWVSMEVAAFRDLAAHDAGRLLLPVRIAQCTVPLLMRGLYWIDAVTLGFDAAIDALAKALRAPAIPSPTPSPPPAPAESADALIKRGGELRQQQKYDEALSAMERALALDPTNANAWYGKGFVLGRLGRHAEADAAWRRADELSQK